jgi:hypothetical protein
MTPRVSTFASSFSGMTRLSQLAPTEMLDFFENRFSRVAEADVDRTHAD